MAKITSKYQVTIPKAVADQYGLRPGDDVDWIPAGDVIRVLPPQRRKSSDDPAARLRLFDQATERHRERAGGRPQRPARERGWAREDLYDRGRSQ